MWRNRYDVEVVYPIDALKLLLARFLNMLYYRTQVSLFRVLSNKLTFGTVVKVHNMYYVLHAFQITFTRWFLDTKSMHSRG
jgi:hypothetical protein